eukprot:scaffold145616_cov18-Tisochrysis_lutea.AAC.1
MPGALDHGISRALDHGIPGALDHRMPGMRSAMLSARCGGGLVTLLPVINLVFQHRCLSKKVALTLSSILAKAQLGR